MTKSIFQADDGNTALSPEASRNGTELTWGARQDLVSMRATRDCYIAAMRSADAGDFVPLLEFARS